MISSIKAPAGFHDEGTFDPIEFYSTYPEKVISRPGYPTRAAFKSTMLWHRYGKQILQHLPSIETYADIGGCFGFGANVMAYWIGESQGKLPATFVFELASGFADVGQVLFPRLQFVMSDFTQWQTEPKSFDLVTLLDVIEHIVNPEEFLTAVASRSRFLLLKTPMETTGEWRGSKPLSKGGANHPDGHVNFFSPASYEALLKRSGFEVMHATILPTIVPCGGDQILTPEWKTPTLRQLLSDPRKAFYASLNYLTRRHLLPWKLVRKIMGSGEHICICRSLRCKG